MEQVIAVTYYTLRELSRRKLLIFLVAGGAGLIVLIAIVVALARANAPAGTLPANDFSGFLLIQMSGLVSLFAWIAAITIAVTLVNHDLESGSAVSIFSKPVSRLQYALGKVLAAALAELLIVLILGIGTQLVVLTNGGGHEAALVKTFVLISANQLTQMLVILILSVLMNNIVAAGIGIVVIQVTKVIGTAHVILHFLLNQGGATDAVHNFTAAVDVVYWLVPRYLDSDLTRDVYASALTTPGNVLSTINVSGPLDVAYWAAYTALLFALLVLVIQRKEV